MAAKKATPKAAPKKPARKAPSKQTSSTVSSLASDVLAGRLKPTQKQIKAIAASALGQDQTKGRKKKPK